ncbi:hypothetical protein C9374_014199 [Naegleria lovaniensis]|uniref:Uncharacterized protein n=1 Tax=Naegleria lovaniensis TaxID=51637 RepID=A0AA88H1E1_NAELO|nr:uncharacterized protein C9374_014199 [Naegleria lovaniensis]KAG2389639.1 hypothetical protein C9374_014199 [Naegleria lovaniensis]
MHTSFAPSHHQPPSDDHLHHQEETKYHHGEGFQTSSSSQHNMMDVHDDPHPPEEHDDHLREDHHNNNGMYQEYLHNDHHQSAYHDVSYEPVVEGSQSVYHQHVHSSTSSSGGASSHHHSGKPKKDLHEVELWLCSKLNSDWSSERIVSQINEETLELFIDDHSHHNYDNFYNLGVSNSQLIKLRFIMCCLSIKKKQMTPTLASYFCTLFKNIIENKRGEDDWVRMMAEILYLFPEHSCIRTDIQKSILHELEMSDEYEAHENDSPQRYFQQAIKHFQALAMKQDDENSSLSLQKLSYSPATSLKPTVSKYLNVHPESIDRAMKELEEKRNFLEEYSSTDGKNLNSNLYSLRHYQPSNKHFTLRSSACKNLIEPLNYLDELENESSKKNVSVKVSPLKKLTPSRPPLSSSGSTSTPTSANLNKNKLPGLKKISSNLPSTPKTTLLKTPPPSHTPTTQLISPPSATSNSAPRSVFLEDSIALQRIKEQQQNEKKRTSNKQLTEEQKLKEKERKKQEKQELKEKKEKEKLEKKKQKEELKRKQMEEKKAAQQAALANGGAAGTGRKRRKNNPANATQDNADQNSMLSPSQDPNVAAGMQHAHPMYGTMLNQAGYLNPMFAASAGTPGGFPPFAAGQYANLLSNTFFSPPPGTAQQGTPQPNQPGMPSVLMPNMGNMQALGKPPQGDQTSFTQLLGINSSPNTRPPNNLLPPPFAPPTGVSSFPNVLFAPGDPASMNMLMRGAQLGANPSAGQPQMRQPPNYPVSNFQQPSPTTTTTAATQNPPQTAQTVVSDEERKAKVETYLNGNILKDCNRVSEETRSKIFNFLIGNTNSEGGFEDKLLIHEEVDNDEKRQIYFHMDHTNRKWKKIMQKQNNIHSGLE